MFALLNIDQLVGNFAPDISVTMKQKTT